jgi:hypothetical protein
MVVLAAALSAAATAWGAEATAPQAVTSSGASAPVDDAGSSPTPAFFDVNKYRADPNNPGAIHLPGTNVALYIGGFAQLDLIGDVQVIGNPDQFVVASIPVGGGNTGNTGAQASARQSRVFIETDAPWSVANLLAYVEVDFFDPQNQLDLHIRHAFGAIGRPDGLRLVLGYTWSSFMDATVIPSQLDYAGPVGLVNVQKAEARLIVPLLGGAASIGQPSRLEWLLSAEEPTPQITFPMGIDATAFSSWPDAVTALRFNHHHGHLLASGLFRQLGALPAMGARAHALGYGGNFTGALTNFWGQDQLLWAVGGGRGIAAYFAGSGGLGLDAFLQPDGQLSVPSELGLLASYQHYFGDSRFSVTGTYSLLHLFRLQAGSDGTLADLQYVGGMFQYLPNRRFMVGVQYLYGQRENRNGEAGSDNRLQASTQIRF